MVSKTLLALLAVTQGVNSFPFVARQSEVDTSLLQARQQKPHGAGSEKNCPYNPNHVPAAPFNPKFPYNYAKDGKKGKQMGGFKVPADGDEAHKFIAPDYNVDIRGPCPGLNTLANHNFLARDGIVTFAELVDAQQNVYNVGYDLAVLLAVLGLTTTDGDIVTEKLSIGCDATSRTSYAPLLTGQEPGLDGHNKFEADASLARNDYFLANGNNFLMNGTLFGQMVKSTGGVFDFDGMAKYRQQRYFDSRNENSHFYFGPLSLLLYGASSFLYELMPSGTRNFKPDLYTISSFFGAEKQKDGSWAFNGKERIPDNWTNRKDPYTDSKVGAQIFEQYLKYPVLFGGNTASGSFDALTGVNGLLEGGKLGTAVNASNTACFLYMLSTERLPTSLNSILSPSIKAIDFAASKLAPQFKNLGCPMSLT